MTDPTGYEVAQEAENRHPPEHRRNEDESAFAESVEETDARSLWSDAWYDLRHKPLFWVSSGIIAVFVLMAIFPQWFTSFDPNDVSYVGDRTKRLEPPDSEAWFGYDRAGRDVYTLSIYGTRVSVLIGVMSALGVGVLGGLLGLLAGYFSGWFDALLSRAADIFFGLPFILGALVLLSTFIDPTKSPDPTKVKFFVILALVVLSWPPIFRVVRSNVIATKHADYIEAAHAIGASSWRIIFRHLLPNSLAPLIVMTTIVLGVFIGAEATLSFLGVGLRPPIISWGVMISESQEFLDLAPHALLFPAAFLGLTVLGFVMLGETVREALDPKLR